MEFNGALRMSQLSGVHDNTNSVNSFKDGNPIGVDYNYDVFGNMTIDRNKGIESILSNHLNLPTLINIGNGGISYLYNAVGVKLAKIASTTSTSQSTRVAAVDYLGGFQYFTPPSGAGGLQFFPTAEGYVSVTGGNSFNYVYNYTDHLGNIRLSYTQSETELKILEENHYYPFGLKHGNYNPDKKEWKKSEHVAQAAYATIYAVLREVVPSEYKYKYKYNGKEFQDELNLNWYDYGARNYDPAIGRWMNIDPLAERHHQNNPYMYANNNPILFIDPDGRNFTLSGEAAKGFVAGMQSSMSWNDNSSKGMVQLDGENDEEEEEGEGDPPIKTAEDKRKIIIGDITPLFDLNGLPNSQAYNCHSFAWSNSMGDPTDPANKAFVALGILKWDNNPVNNKTKFHKISFDVPNQVGDRVIYYAWDYSIGRSVAQHSAIVLEVNKSGQATRLVSKFGEGPLATHHPRDVPSIYGSPNPTYIAPNGKRYASRVYYRKNY